MGSHSLDYEGYSHKVDNSFALSASISRVQEQLSRTNKLPVTSRDSVNYKTYKKLTSETLQEFIDRKGRQELWGDASEGQIIDTIQKIEKHVDYWNDNIHGMTFVFVKQNTGFNVSIFYPNSRRDTTTGEFAKLGLNLRNGTVVDASLLNNTVSVERGRLSQTIIGAFENISASLQKAEDWAVQNWGGDKNTLNDFDDWLPISLSRSIILPNDTMEYLKELTNQLSGDNLRDAVWEAVRNQIHFLVGWQKQRVVDSIVEAVSRETPNTIPLTKFMTQLSNLVSEMKEIHMIAMADQIQQLQVHLDKIDYSYANVENFQVPIGTTQAKRRDTKKVKRSNISIFCWDSE